MGVRRINNRAALLALAKELRVRPDWHEPDEQEVTAECHGSTFDNAGCWGAKETAGDIREYGTAEWIEMWVTLKQEGEPVAEVNLALLFAWATGYAAEPTTREPLSTATVRHAAGELDEVADVLRGRAAVLRDLADMD